LEEERRGLGIHCLGERREEPERIAEEDQRSRARRKELRMRNSVGDLVAEYVEALANKGRLAGGTKAGPNR